MRRSEFRDEAEEILNEHGAQFKIKGNVITWWFEEDKPVETVVPLSGAGDWRAIKNYGKKLAREIEATKPAHLYIQRSSDADKWKAYLDKSLRDVEARFEAKFEAIKGDISASTDIALDAGLKVDGFTKIFQGAFAGQQPSTVTISSPAPQTIVEQPKIAIAPSLPKPPAPVQIVEKGLDALGQLRAKQWADALAEIDDPEYGFDLSDLDGRILYFLYKCGPQTPHDLKMAGVWRSADSATRFLENKEAEGLVRFLVAERRWAITNEGIASLDEDSVPEPATSPILAMHATPVTVAPKPALTIVPSGPRILKPLENVASLKLTFPEKAMVALLKKDMTIDELQKAIRHPSSQKSLLNMLYACEKKDRYIEFRYDEGRVWRITEKGRAYIMRVSEYTGHTLAAG